MKSLLVETDRDDLLRRLTKITPDSPRQWGRMTPHQMICHLSDSYFGCMGGRTITPATSLFNRTFVKWIALRTPAPWPKGVPTRPEVDQEVGGTPPVDFGADVERLASLVERFSRRERDFDFVPHPIFGAMSEWEWMRWGYLHADHHFRQFGA
jgi:hypothetical protein